MGKDLTQGGQCESDGTQMVNWTGRCTLYLLALLPRRSPMHRESRVDLQHKLLATEFNVISDPESSPPINKRSSIFVVTSNTNK